MFGVGNHGRLYVELFAVVAAGGDGHRMMKVRKCRQMQRPRCD